MGQWEHRYDPVIAAQLEGGTDPEIHPGGNRLLRQDDTLRHPCAARRKQNDQRHLGLDRNRREFRFTGRQLLEHARLTAGSAG